MKAAVAIPSKPDPVFVDLNGFDRIRESSSPKVNARVARRIEGAVECYGQANKAVMSARIDDLEHEWDIDRSVMLLLSVMGSAVLLGSMRRRKLLGLLGVQLTFLGIHAAKGWCPPVSILRRLGFRSRSEIDAERYALKTIRGDFDPWESTPQLD